MVLFIGYGIVNNGYDLCEILKEYKLENENVRNVNCDFYECSNGPYCPIPAPTPRSTTVDIIDIDIGVCEYIEGEEEGEEAGILFVYSVFVYPCTFYFLCFVLQLNMLFM